MSGIRNTGSVSGRAPMSPTVRRSKPKNQVIAVSTTMVTSGEGMAVVISGNR
jgi:hypothetical protein